MLEFIQNPSEAPEFTPSFSGVRVTRSLVLYVCFVDRCLSFVLFLLAIVLSVLLRYTDSECPCDICKLFVYYIYNRIGNKLKLAIVVSNTYCVVVLFLFVLCTWYYQFLSWIVHFWLHHRYAVPFIYANPSPKKYAHLYSKQEIIHATWQG
jgi:hypothetical protein